jgi:hypothetical protein
MSRYLIRVWQPAEVAAKQVNDSIRTIGSHFATHATWRQQNGMATGTLVVEADDRRWAIGVVPPNMRSSATIFRLDATVPEVGSAPPALDGATHPYQMAA